MPLWLKQCFKCVCSECYSSQYIQRSRQVMQTLIMHIHIMKSFRKNTSQSNWINLDLTIQKYILLNAACILHSCLLASSATCLLYCSKSYCFLHRLSSHPFLVSMRILVIFLCTPSSVVLTHILLLYDRIYSTHSFFLSCRHTPTFVIVPSIILNDSMSKTFDIKYIVLFIEMRKSPLSNAIFPLNT